MINYTLYWQIDVWSKVLYQKSALLIFTVAMFAQDQIPIELLNRDVYYPRTIKTVENVAVF